MYKNLEMNNLSLSYLDVRSDIENAIVFIHGNSLDASSFKHQFSSSMLKNYRLLAIELPGHGRSDPDIDYNLPKFASQVAEIIQRLGLTHYILVGHSLGGHVAIEALEHLTPAGIMILGTPPISKPIQPEAFLPHPVMPMLYTKDLSDQEIMTLLRSFHFGYSPTALDVERFKQTDSAFRESFAVGLGQDLYKDELSLWKNFRRPKAIVVGSQDVLVNTEHIKSVIDEDSLWQGVVLTIAGGHSVHMDNPSLFNETLDYFAGQCFAQQASQRSFPLFSQQDTHATHI